MRLLGNGPLLIALLTCGVRSADIHKPLHCDTPDDNHVAACAHPVHGIVALAPGASYLASLACPDCPYKDSATPHGQAPPRADQLLAANMTLAADKGSLLLNGQPVYPLPTIPTPPTFFVAQRPAALSNADLSAALACPDPHCRRTAPPPACVPWCTALRLSVLRIDYLYTVAPARAPTQAQEDTAVHYRELTLDILGGSAGPDDPPWTFASAKQQTLWLLLKEKRSTRAGRPSDLFGPHGEPDGAYDLEIVDLRLEPRSFKLPPQEPLGLWRSIGRFFGTDVWEDDGRRFLYVGVAWGQYGKKGTLRNAFGHLVHWPPWIWVAYVTLGSTAAIAVLVGAYRLYFWIQRQKQLMAWDGIEHVWDRLRDEPAAHEGETFLSDAYQDDPDVGSSSPSVPYTDEPHIMKPLPHKPLPEKPLPSVPLIDT